MTTYGVGSVVTLTTQVADSAGTLVDPAGITLTIQLPDATTVGPFTLPDVVHEGTGLYRYDYTTTTPGRHIARWASTTPTGVDEEPFEVAAEWAEAGVLSLREGKKQLNIAEDDTDYDEEIAGFIRSVTEICERFKGALARTTHVEKHQGGHLIALLHAPVLSVTSVVSVQTGAVAQNVADLDVDGPTGIVQRLDGGYMCGPLRVTYTAGRTSIPPNVRQAALILLQHMWETQRGTQGGVRVGWSDEVYDPRFGFSVPRRVLELLGDQPPLVG